MYLFFSSLIIICHLGRNFLNLFCFSFLIFLNKLLSFTKTDTFLLTVPSHTYISLASCIFPHSWDPNYRSVGPCLYCPTVPTVLLFFFNFSLSVQFISTLIYFQLHWLFILTTILLFNSNEFFIIVNVFLVLMLLYLKPLYYLILFWIFSLSISFKRIYPYFSEYGYDSSIHNLYDSSDIVAIFNYLFFLMSWNYPCFCVPQILDCMSDILDITLWDSGSLFKSKNECSFVNLFLKDKICQTGFSQQALMSLLSVRFWCQFHFCNAILLKKTVLFRST